MKQLYLLLIITISFITTNFTVEIDDFSNLNKTVINKIVEPKSYQELASILREASNPNLKVSISGSRHSQGGHSFCSNSILVSLKKLNKIISLSSDQKFMTVQCGATWKEVQDFLNPRGLAVKIMQFANVFTVGGSLSVNCNGVDPKFGPIIESVKSIKIMLHNGEIVTANRYENIDLFKSAIGGYGLLGIILEVDLEVVKNSYYQREASVISLNRYIEFVKNIKNDTSIGFHFAYFKFNFNKKFHRILSIVYKEINENNISNELKNKLNKLYNENFIPLRRYGTQILRKNSIAKFINGIPEVVQSKGRKISRNNIMRPPVAHMGINSEKETDLLQEYFIPVDNLINFIDDLQFITKKLDVNLMHTALRFIPKNTESLLSYTKKDNIGVVLYLSQKKNNKETKNIKNWTQFLINSAIKNDGTYYLPIQLHASKEQVERAYPEIKNFFEFKRSIDPNEIFQNCFYKKYI